MFFEEVAAADKRKDAYPSRDGQTAQLIARRDPVLYGADAAKSPIDFVLVKQYQRQGFLILEDVFTDVEIDCFRNELERLRTDNRLCAREEAVTEPGSADIRSIFQVDQNSLLFKKLACDRRLAGLAQYLLGDEVYVYQSRVNYKPGFRGKEFYWHSDFETWHVEDGMPRMRALSMSIALTDNYACNGPLMLIPGSHHYYAVCEGQTPEQHYKSSLKKQQYGVPSNRSLRQLVKQGGIVQATAKAGSVIIFDCNLMHGSGSNITPYPRSNVFFVYNARSNQVMEPFDSQSPRPEYLCRRKLIKAIVPQPIDYKSL